MSRWIPLLLALPLFAQAAEPASLPPEQIAAERQRIAAERQQGTDRLDAEEAACQSKFAVNNCVRPVQVRRRALLAEFKRQEVRLNDMERKERAQTQRKAVEQRQQERAEQLLQPPPSPPAAPAPSEKGTSRAPVDKAPRSAPDAAMQAENRAAYQRKLEEAERHRKDLERQRQEKPSKATSLPLPP